MKLKKLASMASGGDANTVRVLMMVLPEGMMPEGSDPAEFAAKISGDESFSDYSLSDSDADFVDKMGIKDEDIEDDDPMSDDEGTGFPDMKLIKGIAKALQGLGLDDHTEKIVCNAIYDGILGGKIFPRNKKGQEHAEGNPHPKKESGY